MELEPDDPSECNLKCEYQNQEENPTAESFKIDMVTLRNKRTIQQKIVEYMLLRIFSKQSIFSLVDILFKDMKEDYKAIEKENASESEGEDKEEEHCHGHEQVEEDYVDPT